MGKLTLLAGIAAGAGATYLLDPARGSERRHKLVDRFRSAREKISDEQGHLAPRDLLSRTKEAVSDMRSRLQNGYREELAGEARETAREMASTSAWSPRTRLVAAGLGGALTLYGLRRSNLMGLAFISVGTALVARGITNFELRRSGGEEDESAAFTQPSASSSRTSRSAPPPQYQREDAFEPADVPTAADLRNRAAEEEMTAFTENPDSIPSD
ncbi:MAG TPA: hypothetical protein VGR43_02630 [Dehalococcoidia bacterium]|jgi:gas vesicle protein|nr:hypothetical protein [Dehalococcoidia bacterium]